MGFFNPISYFIKSFIRIFTRKFFWIILICVCLFLGFILFNNSGVFGATETFDLSFTYKGININLTNIPHISDNFTIQRFYDGYNNLYILNFYSTDASYIKLNSSGNYFSIFDNNNISLSCIATYKAPISNPSTWTVRGTFSGGDTTYWNQMCYNTVPAYFYDGSLYRDADPSPFEVQPYFITTDTELQTFDFDYLQINGGTTKYHLEDNTDALLRLDYLYKGVQYTINLDNYITVNGDNTWQVNIPYNVLTNNIMVRNGESFKYTFVYFGDETYILNKELTYDLTSEQETQINEDSNKQLQSDIYNSSQETNNKLDNVQNSINDSNVDDSNVDDFSSLGDGFDAEDNTGIDELFQMLYDAFCSNEIEDLTFTIPFVNKQVTINASNISNNFPDAIKNIVGVFVWGMVGLWVIKDIRSIIDKISEGSPEDVGSDVKKEVL